MQTYQIDRKYYDAQLKVQKDFNRNAENYYYMYGYEQYENRAKMVLLDLYTIKAYSEQVEILRNIKYY